MNNIETERLMGYNVSCSNISDLVDFILNWILEGSYCKLLSCINPHSYVVSLHDSEFSKALNGSDWLIPDGTGILIASKLHGGRINQRITGSDIFHGIHNRMNITGGKVFFLGSSETTLNRIYNRMRIDWPKIQVVGTFSPPFKASFSQNDNREMLTAVNAVSPDVLWVGMTAPKQEKWLFRNRELLNVKFAGGVGAVFDFYIGKVKRPHPMIQQCGLEWLPRLIREPRKLWSRSFISTPKFLYMLAKERKISRKKYLLSSRE